MDFKVEDTLYLQNIEEYVYDMDKIVTYKWLAMTLSVSFNEAARMLSAFVRRYSAPPPQKDPITVTYLVTGVSRDDCNGYIDKVVVSLAGEDELEEIKATLTEVSSVVVYSVQKGRHNLKDKSLLFTSEYDVLKENLHKYYELCCVKCSQICDEQHNEAPVAMETSSLPTLSFMTKEEDHKSEHHVKPVLQDKPAQPAKIAKKPSKAKGVVALFANKQLQNASQKACKLQGERNNKQQQDTKQPVVVKSEEQLIIDDETVPVKLSAKKSKTSKVGQPTTFDKDVFTTDDGDDVINDDFISKKEQRQRTVNRDQAAAKEQITKKGKDLKIKRRRICQELSSEDSGDENAAGAVGQEISKLIDVTKKRRKVVRRLVDKMYVDEDGSMVTEKQWQDISTDDDDDNQPIVTTSNKSKARTKSKQSKLGTYFHKK